MEKGRKVSSTTKSHNIDVTSEHGSTSDSDDDLLDDLSKASLLSMCELLDTIEGQDRVSRNKPVVSSPDLE